MKKSVLIFLLLACVSTIACGQKWRPGQPTPKAKAGVDFPIKVHISGIRMSDYCNHSICDVDVQINARRMDSKKVECDGDLRLLPRAHRGDLVPGSEYQARLMSDARTIPGTPIGQVYELVWSDRTTWLCTVMGVSE